MPASLEMEGKRNSSSTLWCKLDQVTVTVDEEKEIDHILRFGDVGRLLVDDIDAAKEHVMDHGHVVGGVDRCMRFLER